MPEHGNIGSECDEGTDGYLIHSDYDNTCKIKGNNSQAPAEIDDRTDGVIQADRMDKGIPVLLCQLPEGFHGFFFGPEALDDPDTGQIFVDKSIQVGRFFPVDLPSFVRACLDIPDADCH